MQAQIDRFVEKRKRINFFTLQGEKGVGRKLGKLLYRVEGKQMVGQSIRDTMRGGGV